MQKLVKGATKPKATAPKAKYIEPILATTYEAGRDFEAVMDALGKVIARGGAWPSIYKALIVVHIMIREGAEDVTLKYIARHPHMLEIEDTVHRAPAMGRYARYLAVRGQQFREVKVDFIRYKTRQGFSRLHNLTVQKGLMRECGSVLVQLDALMKCQLQEQDIVNDDVLLMAFRLLVHDVLSLFQVLNEGVINLLEHFFELSKPDAEQALDIYRGFRRLTAKVIAYLHAAKDLEFKTRVHVPNIKHAPTSLVSSLEMYLNDPDFDTNRRQYLAEKQAHEVKRTKSQQSRTSSVAKPASHTPPKEPPAVTAGAASTAQPAAGSQAQVTQPTQVQLQGQAQQQVLPQSTLQQTLAPGSIQMVSPELSTNSNPFWQSQQDAAQIQARDGQAQLQMQQLHQLHLQQIEQQERIRQQIQQLEQQNQQAQQAQQVQQQQLAQQQAQGQSTIQQVPYMEPSHTGYDPGFDFGLGPQPQQAQQAPQQMMPMQQGQAQLQLQPLQQQLTQPIQQQLQPQYTQPLQPQYTQPLQPQLTQPIQQQPTGAAAAGYTNPFQHASPTSTNPFKSPQPQKFDQFEQFDQIGNQIGAQQSLIDFGQPQQTYQPTGTNPFRV